MNPLVAGVVQVAVVAVIALWYARRTLSGSTVDAPLSPSDCQRPELKRARLVLRELDLVTRRLREELATHQQSLKQFRSAVTQADDDEDGAAFMRQEAARLMRPTVQLAARISHAHDEMRQHGNLLMTLAEIRNDSLTGLGNRKSFDESAVLMLNLFSRYGRAFSVIKLDIDRLCRVNERSGKLYGDHVLQQLSMLLDRIARETDVVSRYGDDEFAVLLPETDLIGCSVFAERLRQYVDEQLPITLSIGITTVLDGDRDVSHVLCRCDESIVAAKSIGGNRVYQHCGAENTCITRHVARSSRHESDPFDATSADDNEFVASLEEPTTSSPAESTDPTDG